MSYYNQQGQGQDRPNIYNRLPPPPGHQPPANIHGPGVPPRNSSYVVKRGYVLLKEDGLRSFIWSKRWLLLREQTLTFHRNEVPIIMLISLDLSFIGICNPKAKSE
jgi:hypothetical protein